jgi:hypothetical protein
VRGESARRKGSNHVIAVREGLIIETYYCEKCGFAYNADTGAFCENCGTAYNVDTGAFCESCGNPPETDPILWLYEDELRENETQSDASAGNKAQTDTAAGNSKPEIVCPKCGGTKLQISHEIVRKGYGGGKACCGALALGPFGLLCGMCGKDKVKAENVYWICETCGNVFTAKVNENTAPDGTKTFETQYGGASANEDDTSWKTGWSSILKPGNIVGVIVSFITSVVLYEVCEYAAFELFSQVLVYNLFDRNDMPSFIKSLIIFLFVVSIPIGVADAICGKIVSGKKARGVFYLLFSASFAIFFIDKYNYYGIWLPFLIPLGLMVLGGLGMALEEFGVNMDDADKKADKKQP